MHFLGISGSLRRSSFNTGLLRHAAAVLPAGHTLKIADLHGLPLFDEDLEAKGAPPAVAAFRGAIGSADALLFAATEYNYGMSGVLKNAVDWASRPYPADRPEGDEAPEGDGIYTVPKCPLTTKPAAIMGASAGIGGTIRAQLGLRQSLQLNSCLALPQPEVFVTFAYSGKFDPATGDLLDPQTKVYVQALVEALIAWVPVARLPGDADRGAGGGHGARGDGNMTRRRAGAPSPPRRDASIGVTRPQGPLGQVAEQQAERQPQDRVHGERRGPEVPEHRGGEVGGNLLDRRHGDPDDRDEAKEHGRDGVPPAQPRPEVGGEREYPRRDRDHQGQHEEEQAGAQPDRVVVADRRRVRRVLRLRDEHDRDEGGERDQRRRPARAEPADPAVDGGEDEREQPAHRRAEDDDAGEEAEARLRRAADERRLAVAVRRPGLVRRRFRQPLAPPPGASVRSS